MIGLIYREVGRVLEVDPNGDGKSPDHLIHSSFEVKHPDKIQSFLDLVVLPS